MDITISEIDNFYTVSLHTEHAINFTKANKDIPSHMNINEGMFLEDSPEEMNNFIAHVLKVGMKVSLNGAELTLNDEGVILYAQPIQ